ncbi:RICIN domain-containing protein [Planobispora siamensis]|uniref:Ricin B lectin domain-containing protein n=1 Tax=Planobispora siamensis TaxID=936338 RepID=A0A8J3WJW8_9ACTN|nr:hypothetical protein Psi01_27480 [Planobispora siamensis]
MSARRGDRNAGPRTRWTSEELDCETRDRQEGGHRHRLRRAGDLGSGGGDVSRGGRRSGPGAYTLVNGGSGKCLNIKDNPTAAGALVQQNSCDSAATKQGVGDPGLRDDLLLRDAQGHLEQDRPRQRRSRHLRARLPGCSPAGGPPLRGSW